LNVPVKCAHCETAPCLLGCPVGAIRRDRATDAVLVDDPRCIGCFSCVLVCPYGAIRLSHDRKRIHKCDSCVGRLAGGQEPACSASCPTRALAFREVEELARERTAATAAREAVALRRGRELEGRAPSPMETILEMREEMTRG
jgi:carbon-monoxide dehydrogenase iron sulfur subunit